MRLVHHPGYHLNLGEHVFPSTKFQLIHDWLIGDGHFREENIVSPDSATDDQLCLAHERSWVDALTHGTLTMLQIMQLEIPYSQQMVRAFKLHAGGTILAAQLALEDGVCMNIGGGFHHAFPAHGEGFCALHDVAVAIRVLQHQGRIRRALVIDCDVHHGNGTAAMFADDPSVFTISLHQYNNYPSEKPPSNIDVHLPDGMGDDEYVARLQDVLSAAVTGFRPEFIAYIAGADPFHDDQLGGLALSMEGLLRRDRTVFEIANGIPVTITLAGGYARRLDDTIRIHCNTAICAAANFR